MAEELMSWIREMMRADGRFLARMSTELGGPPLPSGPCLPVVEQGAAGLSPSPPRSPHRHGGGASTVAPPPSACSSASLLSAPPPVIGGSNVCASSSSDYEEAVSAPAAPSPPVQPVPAPTDPLVTEESAGAVSHDALAIVAPPAPSTEILPHSSPSRGNGRRRRRRRKRRRGRSRRRVSRSCSRSSSHSSGRHGRSRTAGSGGSRSCRSRRSPSSSRSRSRVRESRRGDHGSSSRSARRPSHADSRSGAARNSEVVVASPAPTLIPPTVPVVAPPVPVERAPSAEMPPPSSSVAGVSVAVSGGSPAGPVLPVVPVDPGVGSLMPLMASSVAPSTWSGQGSPAPVVHIVGDSYIQRAAQRAVCHPGGRSLGFQVAVHWRGIAGLPWSQVLMESIQISGMSRSPVVLVIHSGGNDLRSLRVPDLIVLMRADIERIFSFFSEVLLVWSEIVPRVTWQSSGDAAGIERARRTVNSRMARFVRARSGVVVRHKQLEGDNSRFMSQDGVHLNDEGSDIFLAGIQEGIKQALHMLRGGRSSSCGGTGEEINGEVEVEGY